MKYTKTHEWVIETDGIATIGVTDYAQNELGDIVYVELPKVGQLLKAGDVVVVLESTKAAADVYSPVSGKIIEVNERLKNESEQINHSAEKEGWLYRIQLSDPSEIENLMTQDQYLKMVKA